MKALAAASEAMDPEQVVEALDSLLPALAGSFSPGIMHLSRDLISLKSALLRAQQAPEESVEQERLPAMVLQLEMPAGSPRDATPGFVPPGS